MKRRFHRTAAAVLLTAAAVIVPCTAWYVVGSSAAREDAEELSEAPLRHAASVGLLVAERLGGRLESMREAESRRPFYHYQQLYHDPASTCECASVTPSPLSAGPHDPLVRAHFQIDPSFKLTLPTLPEDESEVLGEGEWICEQRDIRDALEKSTLICLRAAQQPSPFSGATAQGCATGATRLPDPKKPGPELEFAEWGDPIDITHLEDFSWYTLDLESDASLVAMRRVVTLHGDWVQGFVISFQDVSRLLEDASYPAHILPRKAMHDSSTRAEVDIPLEGVDWAVVVDAGEPVNKARKQGEAKMASFHRLFAGGTSAAVLAGLCMIWLVWQSDRLARQRARFAAAAAHELRTPLAGMQLYGEMLAEGLGDPQRHGTYAARIAAEAERLGRVVSNVLGYTQLERGSVSLRVTPGDLAATVTDAVDRMRPALEVQGAQIQLQVEGELPPLRFDPDAVHQMVQNLVDNAEKYSRGAEDRCIEVGVARRGGCCELSVRDHGPGVDSGMRDRLFRPFERGVGADGASGLGLGLTLVANLATEHGGQVSCEDAPGGGALFRVSFPCPEA